MSALRDATAAVLATGLVDALRGTLTAHGITDLVGSQHTMSVAAILDFEIVELGQLPPVPGLCGPGISQFADRRLALHLPGECHGCTAGKDAKIIGEAISDALIERLDAYLAKEVAEGLPAFLCEAQRRLNIIDILCRAEATFVLAAVARGALCAGHYRQEIGATRADWLGHRCTCTPPIPKATAPASRMVH
jgi:hypothetical protein